MRPNRTRRKTEVSARPVSGKGHPSEIRRTFQAPSRERKRPPIQGISEHLIRSPGISCAPKAGLLGNPAGSPGGDRTFQLDSVLPTEEVALLPTKPRGSTSEETES